VPDQEKGRGDRDGVIETFSGRPTFSIKKNMNRRGREKTNPGEANRSSMQGERPR